MGSMNIVYNILHHRTSFANLLYAALVVWFQIDS